MTDRHIITRMESLRFKIKVAGNANFVFSVICALLAYAHSPDSPWLVMVNIFASVGSALAFRSCQSTVKKMDKQILELRSMGHGHG